MRVLAALVFMPLCLGFVPASPLMGVAPVRRARAAGSLDMIFGLFDNNKKTESAPSASSAGKRLNLKDLKNAPPAKKAAAPVAAKKPLFAAKPAAKVSAAAKPTGPPPTTRGANGKLQGYFSEEQVEALIVARSTVPSNAPKYWETIASMVPGQTPETCKAMAYQIAFDKSAGTKKNFFGGNIEVKETKMYVDTSATPMNRFKEAFGLK